MLLQYVNLTDLRLPFAAAICRAVLPEASCSVSRWPSEAARRGPAAHAKNIMTSHLRVIGVYLEVDIGFVLKGQRDILLVLVSAAAALAVSASHRRHLSNKVGYTCPRPTYTVVYFGEKSQTNARIRRGTRKSGLKYNIGFLELLTALRQQETPPALPSMLLQDLSLLHIPRPYRILQQRQNSAVCNLHFVFRVTVTSQGTGLLKPAMIQSNTSGRSPRFLLWPREGCIFCLSLK